MDPFTNQPPIPQIPAEIYPTEARATCHGISAAFGKAGAAIGAAVFLRIVNSHCPNHFCTKDSPREGVDRGVKYVFSRGARLALGLDFFF